MLLVRSVVSPFGGAPLYGCGRSLVALVGFIFIIVHPVVSFYTASLVYISMLMEELPELLMEQLLELQRAFLLETMTA